jgi:hypothetical protein
MDQGTCLLSRGSKVRILPGSPKSFSIRVWCRDKASKSWELVAEVGILLPGPNLTKRAAGVDSCTLALQARRLSASLRRSTKSRDEGRGMRDEKQETGDRIQNTEVRMKRLRIALCFNSDF